MPTVPVSSGLRRATPTSFAAGTGANGIVVTDTPATYGSFGYWTASQLIITSAVANTNTGWFAAMVRMGFASSSALPGTNAIVASVDNGTNSERAQLIMRANGTTPQWQPRVCTGGVCDTLPAISDTFAAGDVRTVFMTYNPSTIAISLAGAAFVSNARSKMPVGATIVNVGGSGVGNQAESAILQVAFGVGTLTNADVAVAAAATNWVSPDVFPLTAQMTALLDALTPNPRLYTWV